MHRDAILTTRWWRWSQDKRRMVASASRIPI